MSVGEDPGCKQVKGGGVPKIRGTRQRDFKGRFYIVVYRDS